MKTYRFSLAFSLFLILTFEVLSQNIDTKSPLLFKSSSFDFVTSPFVPFGSIHFNSLRQRRIKAFPSFSSQKNRVESSPMMSFPKAQQLTIDLLDRPGLQTLQPGIMWYTHLLFKEEKFHFHLRESSLSSGEVGVPQGIQVVKNVNQSKWHIHFDHAVPQQ
ncbi:hypothetical protein TNCV_3971121 [Trichonephila clavipes]|nr:hypothetical protein TNCV_3971121 [Trichonephila clavipes]